MIEINISESPDIDSIGLHQFKSNKVTLGTKKNNNIILYDQELYKKEFSVIINDDKCILRSADKHFFIAGKKYLGAKVLVPNEEFTIGKTKISVTRYQSEKKLPASIAEHITSKKNNLYMDDPPLYELIEEIELEFLDLEKSDD